MLRGQAGLVKSQIIGCFLALKRTVAHSRLHKVSIKNKGGELQLYSQRMHAHTRIKIWSFNSILDESICQINVPATFHVMTSECQKWLKSYKNYSTSLYDSFAIFKVFQSHGKLSVRKRLKCMRCLLEIFPLLSSCTRAYWNKLFCRVWRHWPQTWLYSWLSFLDFNIYTHKKRARERERCQLEYYIMLDCW